MSSAHVSIKEISHGQQQAVKQDFISSVRVHHFKKSDQTRVKWVGHMVSDSDACPNLNLDHVSMPVSVWTFFAIEPLDYSLLY